MQDAPSPTALIHGSAPVRASRAMQHAYLWVLASAATAAAILGVGFAVSADSTREAGRMMIEAQKGKGTIDLMIGSLAAGHGRPRGF